MPVTIKHAFVSPKSDGGDATLVRPSDWNASHAWESWDVVMDGLSGKVHRWKFEEASGNFADSVGSLTLVASGSITYQQSSPIGYAASFATGAAGDAASMGSVPVGADPRTSIVVYKSNGLTPVTNMDLFTYGTSGTTNLYWQLDSTGMATIRLVVWANDITKSDDVVQDMAWHMTAGVYLGNAADTIYLYHDGAVQSRVIADLNTGSATNPKVGGNDAVTIADVTVFDRALARWELDRLRMSLLAALSA